MARVRFDDRLATVLAQPAEQAHDRNVRWRQLVDLVARSNGDADPAFLERALSVIVGDRSGVPEHLRAAAARAIAGQPVPGALLVAFASDTLAVAAPLLAGADLKPDTLAAVRSAASPEVAQLLASLHGPAEAPPPVARSEPPPPPPPPVAPEPSISDVVARLDRARTARARPRPAPAAPQPAGEGPALFRWECSASGEIDWVDGAPRGPLIGRSIAVADPDEGVDDCVERAFAIRAPFRDCLLELGDDGRLAGHWTISGAPAFAPADGRFVGYRGIARRGDPAPAPAAAASPAPASSDTLREMIHEIKTPLNAIIGFAEIIDGQYFGPAHRRYRERAAEIVTNAKTLLEAANDLDFVARAQSVPAGTAAATDLAPLLTRLATTLTEQAAKSGATLDLDLAPGSLACALDALLSERLLARFGDAVVGAASPGEHLLVRARAEDGRIAIAVTRPRATVLAAREDLLDPEFSIGQADRALLGIGFSLRLVTGLVELAGGAFVIDDERFTLLLPAA
ncbi:histidine kinase dimerization/phospho-acceptor domain-containing protein [Sphingomonas mesophila]|uniref:histidine kinase dimerization/phospho-acceptor domain-containing protein n=1 Tax=Sphingomonas mesophila TaxID=2303576 RepID=UPI000E57C59D|nr:HAMP domain-containing sensor histidine kinase [Sphingomonas mesophila]